MSATNVQFSMALHVMAALAHHYDDEVTTARLASSVKADPSFVRRTISKLAKAGLIETTRGPKGACRLTRPPARIDLLEIYRASGAPSVFAVHDYPIEPLCPISCEIKDSTSSLMKKAQSDFERSLSKTTLADVLDDLERRRNER